MPIARIFSRLLQAGRRGGGDDKNATIDLEQLFLFLISAGQVAPNPWFGTWKLRLKDPKERPENLVYSDAGNGAMRMVSVEDDGELITHFDGKPSFDLRAKNRQLVSLAVKPVSSRAYTWTLRRPGRPDIKGSNTLADDGRSFKEVSWDVSKPNQIITFIYDRER